MDKSAEYHRDIYAGIVASALGKEGYFGQEQQLYGFCYLKGTRKHFYINEKELECAFEWLKCWRLGYQPQRWQSIRYWQDDDDSFSESIKENFKEKLQSEDWLPKKNMPTDSQTAEALHQYWNELTPSQKNLSSMAELITAAKIHSYALELMDKEMWEKNCRVLKGKQMAGTAWLDSEGSVQYYCNGYLPAVLEKRWELLQKGLKPAGVYQEENRLGYQYKKAFAQKLQTIFDKDYLRIWQQLFWES